MSGKRIAAEDLPGLEKLRRIIRYQIGYLADHQPLVQVFFSELVNLPQEMARSVAHANRAFRKVIERVVADGVQKGELIPLNPKRFTYALIGMCNWTHRWYQPGGEWTPDTVADEIIRILEPGYLVQSTEPDDALLLREVRAVRQEVHHLQSALAPQTVPLRRPGKRLSRKPQYTRCRLRLSCFSLPCVLVLTVFKGNQADSILGNQLLMGLLCTG
jgi:hypothetical protein